MFQRMSILLIKGKERNWKQKQVKFLKEVTSLTEHQPRIRRMKRRVQAQ